MKALIVESDCEEADHIAMTMNLYLPDIELLTTNSDKQCINIIKENSLGIVILGDLTNMPSFDVIEKIRSFSEVPIMALSRISDESSLVKALDAGANGYMAMPIRQLEFIARIRAVLRRKKIISNQGGVLIHESRQQSFSG